MTKREIAMWARSARRFSPTARNIGLRDGINAVHVISLGRNEAVVPCKQRVMSCLRPSRPVASRPFSA
jgi:hypothetical protein